MTIQNKPNPLTRLRAAINFYKHGWRKFDLLPRETKKVPFIWPAWYNGQPQWQLINYEAYANEGYNANAIIYSAIMYKARSITIAPLRAYKGTPEQPELLPPDNPLQALCMRPNKFQSWSEFQAAATVYFNLSGNNYTVLERQGDQISGMYNLRPDRVFIVPTANKKQLIGYWYVPEGQAWVDGIPYLPQDVIHIKLPNPMDPLDGLGYGVSPLSPAAHNGDVDNDLTKFFRLFFKGGAMPPGILSFDVPMLDSDITRAKERWMEIYGGSENWKDIAVLDQGGKYEKIGYTFQEMDVSAIDARNESRIVGPFGVPLTLIESRPQFVSSTYNNKREDRQMFWQDTMVPELQWFEVDYRYYLQSPASNEFVMFDLSKVPALSMEPQDKIEAFGKGYERGAVLKNEYRAELGLDPLLEEEKLSEQPEPPATTDDMEGQPEAEEQAEEEMAKTNGNLKKKSISANFDRLTFWTKADRQASDYETEFGDAAVGAFEQDMIWIEATINQANREALNSQASLNWDIILEAVAIYFAIEGAANANWQRNFSLPIFELMAERINTLDAQFGQVTSAADLLSQQWFNEYTIQFAQPINATTEETIRHLIEQGVQEGWSIPTSIDNLETVFNQWMTGNLTPDEFEWFSDRMPAYRREMIARTETIKAMNQVSYRLFGEWGVTEKEWLATMDNRVRDTHAAADGQRVAIDQAFSVGGYSLQFPGDPAGPAEEIINCRCTILPIMG